MWRRQGSKEKLEGSESVAGKRSVDYLHKQIEEARA
jgi:hypothetical protein